MDEDGRTRSDKGWELTESETTVNLADRDSAEDGLEIGTRLGRYLTLDLIGSGGSGLVYSAYDPTLDRKVAIKLLRDRAQPRLLELRYRLLREAQAIAKISHPNIVAVYDAGVYEDRLYIAMELVEGETLRDWLAPGRDWREIVEVFHRAGQALAAAHEVEIIHRDFKPSNVLVGAGKRVRVLDFGLAASPERDPERLQEGDHAPADGAEGSAMLAEKAPDRLTISGAVMGTPAYMAPEQHLACATDERTDQYNFCVTLFRGLYGRSPFFQNGERVTIDQLYMRKAAGLIADPPSDSRVPARIHKIVVRGLAADPDERWPSMDELLAALNGQTRRARRRLVAAGSAACVCVLGLLAAVLLYRGDQPVSVCAEGPAQLAEVWSETTRVQARAAFRALNTPFARAAWQRLVPLVDDYADAWATTYTRACQETYVHESHSVETFNERALCLYERLDRLRTLRSLLLDADRTIALNIIAAAQALPRPESCTDRDMPESVALPTDPSLREQVASLRRRLAHTTVLRDAGQGEMALRLAKEITEEALQLDYLPLHAEANRQTGEILIDVGEPSSARHHLQEAVWAAEASGHDDVAAEALCWLAQAVPYTELSAIVRRAEAAILRGKRPDLRAALETARGSQELAQKRFAAAKVHFERALELWNERRDKTLDWTAVRYRNNVGVASARTGDYQASLQHYRAAMEAAESLLGVGHPRTGMTVKNVGVALVANGHYERGERLLRRAVELAKEQGPTHRWVGLALADLAHGLLLQGKHDEALPLQERALAIWQRRELFDMSRPLQTLAAIHVGRGDLEQAEVILLQAIGTSDPCGPSPSLRASQLAIGLSEVYRLAGQLGRARRLAKCAVASLEERPFQRVSLADGYEQLALTQAAAGDCRAARGQLASSLASRSEALGDDHIELVPALLATAACLIATDDGEGAGEPLQRALALMDGVQVEPRWRARASFLRAQTLAAEQGERARELARFAHHAYAELFDRYRRADDGKAASVIARWLRRARR